MIRRLESFTRTPPCFTDVVSEEGGKTMEGKERPQRGERDKLTLRMAGELNQRTKDKADYLGISQNAFLLALIELGFRCYEVSPHLLKEE